MGDELKEAVLAWVRTTGMYARYGGLPCLGVEIISSTLDKVGVPAIDIVRAMREGFESQATPYWAAWLIRFASVDLTSAFDVDAMVDELGGEQFVWEPEFDRGWQDSMRAARVIEDYLAGVRHAGEA
jgi:hypothetical protein